MRMFVGTIVFMIATTSGFLANGQTSQVREESKPIIVKRASGTTERYIVQWTATIAITGGPSTLFHPIE